MKINNRKRWGAVLGLALVASTVGGFAAAAPQFTGDPTTLDWYVADQGGVDDPARTTAGLKLYDAAGAEVTTGSVNAALPAFAAAGGTVRADDTHASLFVHAAQSGTAAGSWPGVQATGTDRFTGAGAVSAPAALAGKPYVRTAGGYRLSDVVASFASAGQGTFGGIYELRLRTSSATQGVGAAYASAFVKVTGDTWAVVAGPEPTQEPAVTQTAVTGPTSAYYGKGFSLTVTVTGSAGSGGTVTVKKGTTVLATKALDADGVIAVPVTGLKLAPGAHALTVAYGGTAQAQASQAGRSITIVRAKSTTTGTLAAATIKASAYPKITARVTAPGVPAATFTGTFTVYDGTRAIKKVTLKATNLGKLAIVLPKRTRGTHYLKVVFSGNTKVAASTSAKYKLVVK
jgi:hypothetical protein